MMLTKAGSSSGGSSESSKQGRVSATMPRSTIHTSPRVGIFSLPTVDFLKNDFGCGGDLVKLLSIRFLSPQSPANGLALARS